MRKLGPSVEPLGDEADQFDLEAGDVARRLRIGKNVRSAPFLVAAVAECADVLDVREAVARHVRGTRRDRRRENQAENRREAIAEIRPWGVVAKWKKNRPTGVFFHQGNLFRLDNPKGVVSIDAPEFDRTKAKSFGFAQKRIQIKLHILCSILEIAAAIAIGISGRVGASAIVAFGAELADSSHATSDAQRYASES